MNQKYIFAVYGTLKSGFNNHIYLEGSRYLGDWQTEPKYTLFDGGFPVVERGGNTSIHCELYETDDINTINDVFGLEGSTPTQYSRDNWYDWDIVKTKYGNAIIFVMNKGKSKRTKVLSSGKWY